MNLISAILMYSADRTEHGRQVQFDTDHMLVSVVVFETQSQKYKVRICFQFFCLFKATCYS